MKGKIEPLALQIGLVLTNMTFTDKKLLMVITLYSRQTECNTQVTKRN